MEEQFHILLYNASFSNFKTRVPEVRLPEVYLGTQTRVFAWKKYTPPLEQREATKCTILFSCLDKQSSLTTPIPNALQRGCSRFGGFLGFFSTASQITFAQVLPSPGTSLHIQGSS